MNLTYRRLNVGNDDEIRFIAETDVTIPAAYDSNFKVDEKAILERISNIKEKFSMEDFMEVVETPQKKIVGFHLIRKVPFLDRFAGNINTLWVDPNFRKQGIGTTLKKHSELWAKAIKIDHLYTWVHVNNSAMLALNKELGFEITNYQLKKKI